MSWFWKKKEKTSTPTDVMVDLIVRSITEKPEDWASEAVKKQVNGVWETIYNRKLQINVDTIALRIHHDPKRKLGALINKTLAITEAQYVKIFNAYMSRDVPKLMHRLMDDLK